MTFLLDTDPCIVYLTGRSQSLRERLDSVGNGSLVVCSVVCAELAFGAAKSQSPDKTLAAQQRFLSRFHSLPFNDAAARVYGPIRANLERAGSTIGANDLLIASIALANDLTLVTHNSGEFSRIPNLRIEDWQVDAASPA